MMSRLIWPATGQRIVVAAAAALVLLAARPVAAQLRIVSYNTTTADPEGGFTTPRVGMEIVLQSIGEELKGGIAKPIDVLLLQEQYTMDITTEAFVVLLNGIYGAGTYARGDLDGLTSDSLARAGRPGIVYNTNTVQLLEEVRFGTVNGSNQPRSTMRYKLQPVGYDAAAVFYAYNSHYKAGTTATDQTRRGIEATSIRTNPTYGSNALGQGAHAIFAGDFNTYTSAEEAIGTLTAAGAGQAVDPLNQLGAWSNNASFAAVHTQSPCVSSCIGAAGGMDDRFDFQLVTGEMTDGEGLSVIPGSYHAFGNNGTTFNQNINAAANTYSFSAGMTYSKSQILNALREVSDHIPVVADYQLPAVMQALADAVPATLGVGQAFSFGVTVSNGANVLATLGADELDYSAISSGAVSGSFLDQVGAALGGGNTHLFALDTSTPGMKSGTITITGLSQQVQNGLITIPISYEVLSAALAGDYNANGEVDGVDYVVWRDTFGQNVANGAGADGNGNGLIDDDDYGVWRANFGNSAGSGGASLAAVPEPDAVVLLLLGGCLAPLCRVTLKRWTGKS